MWKFNLKVAVLSCLFGGIGAILAMYCFKSEPMNSISDSGKTEPLAKSVAHRSATNVPTSFSLAAEKATPVVVHIRAEESQERASQRRRRSRSQMFPFGDFEDFFNGGFSPFYKREGSGSGVIFSQDGYIVTNNHVVEFADIIDVTLNDGRKFRATKVGSDPDHDIAVLRIDAKDLPTIDWAPSENARVGDWVLAIGNPFDYLTSTVTAGIISAKGRDLEIAVDKGAQKFTNFIQTDAAVNPGNSGGALVDISGNLLGINSAIATPTGVYAGYSFAIPIETVREIVEDILENPSQVHLGMEATNMDDELADHLGMSTNKGVLVLKLVKGGAAQFSGIRPFDLIQKIDGKTVHTIEEMEEILANYKLGDELFLQVIRDGELIEIPLRIR